MADFDFPADLVDLERRFLELDAACEAEARRLPSAAEIVESTAVDFGPLRELRARRLEIAQRIQRHSWWETTDKGQMVQARSALRAAAREVSTQ